MTIAWSAKAAATRRTRPTRIQPGSPASQETGLLCQHREGEREMKKISELAVCILLVGATIIAIAAEPRAKIAVVADKAVASKPAKGSEALVHDYRLEREGCCNSQN